MHELTIVAAAAGDPRAGIQEIYVGVIIALVFVMAANYKRLSVCIGVLALIFITSTIVYAPVGMFKAMGSAGSGLLTWAAERL